MLTALTPVSPKLENVVVEYVELDDFLKDQAEAPLVAQGIIHSSSKGNSLAVMSVSQANGPVSFQIPK